VLAGLGHRAVGGGYNQDSTIDLGGTGNHVLDIVGVAGHVDVGVVALFALVLLVRSSDGDTTGLFFGSVIDFIIFTGLLTELGSFFASTAVIAAVRVVLPWSTWPMVPTLTCGLLRSKFSAI
jgi:hypothetical protein